MGSLLPLATPLHRNFFPPPPVCVNPTVPSKLRPSKHQISVRVSNPDILPKPSLVSPSEYVKHPIPFPRERELEWSTPKYKPIPPPANRGITIVWPNYAYIVERDGKYLKTLNPGIHFLNPSTDKIAYVQSMKKQVILVPIDSVRIDNRTRITIQGEVYVKIVDPVLASYGNGEIQESISDLVKSRIPWRAMFERFIFDPFLDLFKIHYKSGMVREGMEENFFLIFNIFLNFLEFDVNHEFEKVMREAWGIECLHIKIDFFEEDREKKTSLTLKEWELYFNSCKFFKFDRKVVLGLLERGGGLNHLMAIEKLRDYFRTS